MLTLPAGCRWGLPRLALALFAVTTGCRAPGRGPAVAPSPMSSATSSFPSDAAVHALLVAAVPDATVHGALVGLVEAGRAPRIIAHGLASPGGPPLDAGSVLEIGSVTKAFTGVLLADMARRSEVRLDEAVGEVLRVPRVPAFDGRPITLADLATHTSGLPAMPTNFPKREDAAAYTAYTPANLLAFLAGHALSRAPGTQWVYSNLVALLGPALAARGGAPYPALLATRVLEPLGMTHTGFAPVPDVAAHGTRGTDGYGESQPALEAPAFQAAGGLKSTMHDLVTFAAANLAPDTAGIYAALRESRRARWGPMNADGDSMALGWATDTLGGAGLTGGTFGYTTYVYVNPREHRAVVVMTNFAGPEATLLGAHLLRPAEVAAPRPTPARALVVAYRAGGLPALLARDAALRAAAPDGAAAAQAEIATLNSVGYWLLRRGALVDAVAVFQRNAERYPDEPNPHDSLGEAYLKAGRLAEAIRSYERAVALAEAAGSPDTTRYRAALERARAAATP